MQRWIALYQAEMSFDDFKREIGVNADIGTGYRIKSEEETLTDVKDILDSFN